MNSHWLFLHAAPSQQPTRSAAVAVLAVMTSLPRATLALLVRLVYHSCREIKPYK